MITAINEFRGYEKQYEDFMRLYYHSLAEDHRRRYAALEALKIGFGGIAYVARVLGMSRRTIYTGIRELETMGNDGSDYPRRPSGGDGRIRRPGGGRPKATQCQAGLAETVEDILETYSAGSPTDEDVRWTDLKPMQLAQKLLHHGYQIGRNTAAKLLEGAGYPHCEEILLTFDAGGANSVRSARFKEDLPALSKRLEAV